MKLIGKGIFQNKTLCLGEKRSFASIIQRKLEQHIAEKKPAYDELWKDQHLKIEDVTVGEVLGGMRGLTGLVYETSKLDPINGITYRGRNLQEIKAKAAKALRGSQPLPEAVLWLFLTGDFPNENEMSRF